MARRLLLLATLAAAAGIGLVACDDSASNLLASAQPGQCYKVAGKNSLGQPKLVHAECGAPGAVTAPAAPSTAVATTSTGAACVAPTLPASPPPCAGTTSGAGTGLSYHTPRKRWFWRKNTHVARQQVRQRTVVRQSIVQDDYVPKSGEVYASQQHYEYARPSEATELAGGYSYRHQETYSAPPPPPPPPVVHRDERRYEGRDYESRDFDRRAYESRAYAESSSSSSARYTSSAQGRRRPCNCSRDRRPVIIEEYERDGYLTWPGKRGY